MKKEQTPVKQKPRYIQPWNQMLFLGYDGEADIYMAFEFFGGDKKFGEGYYSNIICVIDQNMARNDHCVSILKCKISEYPPRLGIKLDKLIASRPEIQTLEHVWFISTESIRETLAGCGFKKVSVGMTKQETWHESATYIVRNPEEAVNAVSKGPNVIYTDEPVEEKWSDSDFFNMARFDESPLAL